MIPRSGSRFSGKIIRRYEGPSLRTQNRCALLLEDGR